VTTNDGSHRGGRFYAHVSWNRPSRHDIRSPVMAQTLQPGRYTITVADGGLVFLM
jgi:hypothetical protein